MATKELSLGVAPSASFSSYLSCVNQFPKLTKEEELELAQNYREHGCLESARRLIMANLRYVLPIVKPYFSFGMAKGDIVQEGNVGLMKAVKLFDPTHNVRLITFAVKWIKAEVHEFIIKNWRVVKLATTKAQRKLFFNLSKFKKEPGFLSDEKKQEVATALDVSYADVSQMEMRLSKTDECFHATSLDEDYLSPEAKIGENEISYWEDERDTNLILNHVHQALRSLNEREQHIMSLRWLGDEKRPFKDLADDMGISIERVRQIEKKALEKVKLSLKSFGVNELPESLR